MLARTHKPGGGGSNPPLATISLYSIMNLSIIIVSYNSEKLLNKIIKKIPKENEIIIIENSLKVDVKKDFEKKI